MMKARHILLAMLLLLTATARAEGDITVIDWDVLRIDSVLPRYCETVPLASDYADYDFAVKVEYPEWAPLTASEARIASRFEVAEALQPEWNVGVINRRGVLDIEFVPVVRSGGEYKKLISCRITVLATPKPQRAKGVSSRAAADRYATSSVLASGYWVKISVTSDGVYRLTPSALASMGFPDPSQVRIFGYGGHLLPEVLTPGKFYDDLPEVPWVRADDGSLLFWANGLVSWDYTASSTSSKLHTTNYCATKAYYFLTTGTPKAMPQEASDTGTPRQTLDSFTNHVVVDNDEFAWASLGRRLYENVSTSTGATRTYTLPTPLPVSGKTGTVRIAFSANHESKVSITPVIGGVTKSPMGINAPGDYMKANDTTAVYSAQITNSVTQVQLRPRTAFDGRLDYIELSYPCQLNMTGSSQLVFRPMSSGITAFDIGGRTDKTQLWRLPEPGLPAARIMPTADGAFVVSDARHRFVAVNTNGTFPEPVMEGAVPNQDLHAVAEDVDMVIITPASGIFDAEAIRLAAAHAESDGLRCRVVRANQIYNEFSSGTPDVSAYRLFMKMLYDRQTEAPRYLLLFGDCASDNRMLTAAWRNYSPDNFLLCYESENSVSDTKAYMCEDFLGMLDDGEGGRPLSDKADVAVGRFPVRTPVEAAIMVNKTIAHLSGAVGACNNRVVFLGDDGDNNSHMDYADRVAKVVETSSPDIEVSRLMWDAYKRVSSTVTNTFPGVVEAIRKANNEGVLMFNYTGHGAPYVLSHESVIMLSDVKAWTNTHYPLWFTAACDVMPIDGTVENIGEAAVLSPCGGAVVFIGTTRTVYASSNYTLNRNFCSYLFGTDAKGRRYSVGDALRLAKNVSGVPSEPNKLHYVLAGDPSLVFGNPLNKVVLDNINGKPAEGQQLKAGSIATMTGHVVDAKGQTLDDFNGTVTARVMDSEVTVTCYNAANVKAGPFVFKDRNKVLYNGVDSVRAGQFSLSFVVPVDINYSNEAGRVNFYASSGRTEANGHSSAFTVGGTSDELANDTIGPAVFITLGDENFIDGSVVCPTPLFLASVRDSSGVNFGGNGIGHDLELAIDGKASTTYNLNEYFTTAPGDFRSGEVAYVIPELAPGAHTLTFRAWDLLNNPTTRTLSFVVDADFRPDMSQVTCSPNPASSYTNIYITHNSAGSNLLVEVDVYDYAGRLLKTLDAVDGAATPTISVRWDLCAGGGAPLGAGIYLLRVRICRDGVWSEGETQKLFILKQ